VKTPTPIYCVKIDGQIMTVTGSEGREKLFSMIEAHTGLDRAMAEAILSRGEAITHPNFSISLE